MCKFCDKISLPKLFLAAVIIISLGLIFGVIESLIKMPKITPPPPAVNKIEISADAKSILNAETKVVLFSIDDAKKYLKDSGYFYNSDTFQTTNARYEGDCFLSAALSNQKDRIVFSSGCLPGDLPQAWVGIVYTYNKEIKTASVSYNTKRLPHVYKAYLTMIKDSISFLTGGSGRNFIWSQDDKTITYEADLGLSGMTETRTIESQTGEILGNKNKNNISDFDNYLDVSPENIPKDLALIFIQDQKGDIDQFCGQKQAAINDFEFISESVDLNGDGIKEFIVTPETTCGEIIRGASNNGPILVYQKINNLWTNIGGLGGNMYAVKLEKSNDYRKIVTYWHLSAFSGTITYYEWNKDKLSYKDETSKEINLDNN